jgi:3-oxoacyl-[acyl-carrier-protein] synthase III
MAYFLFNGVSIAAISSAVPKNLINVNNYKGVFKDDVVNDFIIKAGIETKRISIEEQTSSDLGFAAAKQIIESKNVNSKDIKIIIYISKTPDYRNPPTAAVLHKRLDLPIDCLAYDVNHGSTGFVYGLQIGCSLLQSTLSKYCLVLVGDTNSKQFSVHNPNGIPYGDAATAILLERKQNSNPIHSLTKSFGENFHSYILRQGGFRENQKQMDADPNQENLLVDKKKYHEFVLSELPKLINEFFIKSGSSRKEFDLMLCHQEDKELLNQIYNNLGIPLHEIHTNITKYGNTSGASIPLLLADVLKNDKSDGEQNVLVCAFGEGFSLGVAGFTINARDVYQSLETDEFFQDGTVSRVF